MAKRTFVQGMGMLNLLSDRDWLTILSVLLADGGKEAQTLADTLLRRTKHGRQVQLLRLIKQRRPTIPEMQKLMKVSRRTIFRDLSTLEQYGVTLKMEDGYRYSMNGIPPYLKKLL